MAQRGRRGEGGMHQMALGIFGGLADSYELALDVATLVQDRYWKAWTIRAVGIGPGDSVLDIGCGTCLLEESLDRLGCQVVGIDLTERMIRVGQSKKVSCVEGLVVGDAESLPFPDSSFDAVVSCYVPKYVNVPTFAKEASRVLKPRGRLAVYDFSRPSGPASPLVRLYLHGAIPAAACLLSLAKSEAAATFNELPGIVEGARWGQVIEQAFLEEGVRALTRRKLSAGVVTAFSGRKA